jgi:enoyl-CoA hydratase/carnithine racemase
VRAIFEGITDRHRAELAELGLETFNSQDYKEGTTAFLEKRAPRFQGR